MKAAPQQPALRRRLAVLSMVSVWAFIAYAQTGRAAADAVVLVNGDTLAGRVIKQTDTHVTLQHPVLGRLLLPNDGIAAVRLENAGPQNAGPQNAGPQNAGPQNTGPPNANDQDANTPEKATAGTPATPTTSNAFKAPGSADEPVVSGSETPANAAPPPAAEEAPAALDPEPGLLTWLQTWTHNLDLSFTGASGVNRHKSYLVGYKASRRDDTDRTQFDSRWFQLDNDQTGITQRRAHLQVQQDWFLEESNWFPFVRGRWDYDNRQPWEQRFEGFAGMGYTLSETQRVEANFRVAGGVVHEKFGDNRTRAQSLLSAALLRWEINDFQDLSGEATVFPRINSDDSFRVNTRIEWRLRFAAIDGMSFKLGLENEYESGRDTDGPDNDLLYFAGINFQF